MGGCAGPPWGDRTPRAGPCHAPAAIPEVEPPSSDTRMGFPSGSPGPWWPWPCPCPCPHHPQRLRVGGDKARARCRSRIGVPSPHSFGVRQCISPEVQNGVGLLINLIIEPLRLERPQGSWLTSTTLFTMSLLDTSQAACSPLDTTLSAAG